MKRLSTSHLITLNDGPIDLGLELLARFGLFISRSRLRYHLRPSLGEFAAVGRIYLHVEDIVRYAASITDSELESLREEFEALRKVINHRIREPGRLVYPQDFRVEYGTSFCLYALVRLSRPERVLESGVADGFSSFFILHALKKNQAGALTSSDIRDDVGGLVDPSERTDWRIRILRPAHLKDDFLSLLTREGPFDLFFHDSDHRYRWHSFEMHAVKKAAPHSIILSDDVDSSYAFIDFCESEGVPPVSLFDGRKLLGIIPATDRVSAGLRHR